MMPLICVKFANSTTILFQYFDRGQATSLGSMVEQTTIKTGVGKNPAPTKARGASVSVRLRLGTMWTVSPSITSSVSLVVSFCSFLFQLY